MPKKTALLIGVSEYGEGIPLLPSTLNDVEAIQRVLQNPKLGGFEQITPMLNPDAIAMRRAIQNLFKQANKDDLILLFFSGHGITNDQNDLYLAAQNTGKEDFEATAVDASFIQKQSRNCYSKRQVLILDACYSGAFAQGWQAKSVDVDIRNQLGAEGRVVLTSSSATQTSFAQENSQLSLYTQYLVEGIETGAADQDGDGKIYARELHAYAKAKVYADKPKMIPQIILDREGFDILIAHYPNNLEKAQMQKKSEGDVKIILDKLNKSSRPLNERNFLTDIINQVYKALDNKILVDLNVTIRQDNVKPILIGDVPNTSETVETTLNSKTTILDVFNGNDIKGKLLILSQSGGGKTITILNLQKSLIDKAINDEDFPIPVFLNLSSWKNQNQSMSNWVVEELFLKFGVKKYNAKEWIENQKILPLLDGLDEVNSNLQILCIEAINHWIANSTLNKPLYIVVSCRKEQYDTLKTPLTLYGSLVLEPLTNTQIEEYLDKRKKLELWGFLQKNNKLLELVKKPFLFSIAFESYKKMSKELENTTSEQEVLTLLFNAYEKEMFDRWKKKRFAKLKTIAVLEAKIEKRLVFLAKQLQKDKQNEYKEREFSIENIRLNWLDDNDIYYKNRSILKLIYVLIFRIIIVITFSISLIPFPNIDIKTAVIFSLILAFLIGTDEYSLNEQTVIWGIMNTIDWTKYRNKFLKFLIEYTSIGIIFGLILGLVLHIFHNIIKPIILIKIIIIAIITAVIFGLIVKIFRVKDNSDTTTRISPNQGIKTTIQNAISVFLIVGMISGAIFSFMSKNIQWFIVGFPVGLATGLHYGGFACIQHFILRLILYSQGYIPWNYAQFLKNCTELRFIQRVGGRYLFIHEMLREHFFKKNPKH